MDALTYLRVNWERLLRGERLTAEDTVLTSFLTLTLVAAAVPLAIEGGMVTYEYGKYKGWWK